MSSARRLPRTLLVLVLFAGVLVAVPAATPEVAEATPVATDASTYTSYGRVFPDPHGCREGPGSSPYAEGNVCATDFIQFPEMVAGVEFLASIDPAEFSGLYPDGGRPFAEFVELQRLDQDYADVLSLEDGEGQSAGLPTTGGNRDTKPLYMVKVTDSKSPVAEEDREHFVFALSIHGIERAGVEGGIRAVEDLVTWGATEPDRPLVITDAARSVSVKEALERSVVYFILPNPDGWARGDTSGTGAFYQRYNGNGVDLNRDWPAKGFTFRPYTPLSEPESRSFAKVLQDIKGRTSSGSFTGGNDLHGQLIDRAFSFTLIGGAKRPFVKNQEATRVMQLIWADQETRLSWSPLIKPNSAPEDDPRVYGDQWGTIWDTIDYTVTGALGDWIDSPMGLNGLGLDNEMSLSHLINCGTGKCFDRDAEQLHVDGNKGLIYTQMNLQLQPRSWTFRQPGRTAFVDNPNRVSEASTSTSQAPAFTDLPPQEDIAASITNPPNTPHEFEVQGPDDGVYNGGFTVNLTAQNLQGVSTGLTGVIVERRRAEEPNPEDEWTPVNSDYNQSPIYAQAGATVNVNQPVPGTYRVRLENPPAGQHNITIDFSSQQSWPDPGQVGYDVSNVDFLTELDGHALEGRGFTPVTAQAILGGNVDLSGFDNVVLADDWLPGWREDLPPAPSGPAQETITGSSASGAPGAGERTPATSTFFEFDVDPDANNGELTATVTPSAPADIDLYLQRQDDGGEWGADVAQGTSGSLTEEVLTLPDPRPGHYRLEMHNWAGPPANPLDIEIAFTEAEEPDPDAIEPKTLSDGQRDTYLDRLAEFVRGGGNLLLTDGAMDALRYLDRPEGSGALFPDAEEGPLVRELKVYAGHVEFNDGEEPTYARYHLAKEINRPGAAEGDNNRHQTAEPVPTGYAIQNPSGSDLLTHPNWVVDQEAWEAAGGVTVGTSNDSEGVSFGELPYGSGTIRIIGSLLPMPTEEFDHPFGLDAYGVTYTGYQVFDNALQYVRPGGSWRLAGDGRVETSVEVAKRHWNTIDDVVIANGGRFADALAAVPLAKALDAPIILTEGGKLSTAAFEYLISRNPTPAKAYVIGGEAVLSEQVVSDLERVYIPEVERLAGANRFETSVAVANEIAEINGAAPTKAVIATGEKPAGAAAWPDALAAGPIAANYGPDRQAVPLLLVNSGYLPESVKAYLADTGIEEVLVAGGEAAVSKGVADQLPNPRRIGGRDRVETATLLADELGRLTGETITGATVATAANFPDALVVGSPGGRDGLPTLLYDAGSDASTARTLDWLRAHAADLRQVYVAGGYAVLAPAVADRIEAISRR